MKDEHIEIIYDYFHIHKRIERVKRRIKDVHLTFRSQNFYGGTDFHDVKGIRMKGVRVEGIVPDYVDVIEHLESRLEILYKKEEYFKRYLYTLEHNNRVKLFNKYSGGLDSIRYIYTTILDEQAFDEIIEIEEAIHHEFNTPIPTERQRTIALIEVLDNDNLEDSFQAVSALLGV